MKALILAAGYATRLYPLTIDKPKALLPIAGRAIIYYIVDEIVTLPDIDEIIVISNHRFIKNFLAWKDEADEFYDIKITIVDDNTTSDADKLGAIGDIQYVIDKFSLADDLLVVAGDNLFTYKLIDAWKAFKQKNLDMILAKKHDNIADLQRFAVVKVDENNIVEFLEEKPEKPQSDLAVYASYFYKKETLPLIEKYLEEGNNPDSPGNFPAWLYKRKAIYVYEFEGECFDIGTPESYQQVNEYMQNYLTQQ